MKKIKIIFVVILMILVTSISIYGSNEKNIRWKSKDLGILMGHVLGKDPNEIKSSDLDFIKSIDIFRRTHADIYHVFISDETMARTVPSTGIDIKRLDDFKEFKNLEHLTVCDNNIRDLKPLWKLKNLVSLQIQPNKNIKTIKGIEKLKNLEYVAFRDGEFSPEFTDVSPLLKLPKLEGVWIDGARGIKDLRPFLKIKTLKSLYITADENVDHKPVIDAEYIQELVVNDIAHRIDV